MASRKYNKKDISRFCLMDDPFMKVVFRDIDCTQYLIDVILGEEFKVTDVTTQYHIENLDKRSVYLDIFAKDKNNNICNIEVQNDNEGAEAKRARYHSSLVDMNSLAKSTDFDKLPETYIVFITRNDVLGGSRPLYHINRTIEETGQSFNDKAHIIYVNSSIQDDTSLGRLMHDFYCISAKDMYSPILAKYVSYFKEDVKGVDVMCSAMQEIIDEEMRKTMIKVVQRAYLSGDAPNKICKFVEELSEDEIEEICKQVDNEKQKASQ